MAKQLSCEKYIYKIRSGRLRQAKWKLNVTLAEARRNEEIISLADSQVLRWIDEINGLKDAETKAREIRLQINTLRKQGTTVRNRRLIKDLYLKLDEVQFKPDYMCLIIDKLSDYRRARKGFTINGIKYVRLLGTNGGVKNETIVFVSERVADILRTRIANGRNLSMPLVPAKLEAYQALTCSASIPVSLPRGILVVNDCETEFLSDVIYLDDEVDGEPEMTRKEGEIVGLNESDGYGLMLPSVAERWSEELGLDYVLSGANTRYAWEKGMLYTFDYIDFGEKIADNFIVKDAWGDEVDIRTVEIILTTSMLKLWDSYASCSHYIDCCNNNNYTFGITKTCPKELESQRSLNYQFIQSYDLDDEDIDKLISPTIQEINDIIHADVNKTILFLKGSGLNEKNIYSLEDNFAKAVMVNPEIIKDPYVQTMIFRMIKNRIDRAKVGVLKVHGNYSIVGGDPYALCQSVFGLEVTGLLKAGQLYSKYWSDRGVERVACFRAPMTCHNNIRAMEPVSGGEVDYWYRYIKTATLLNAWDTVAHALNGLDKDGDLVMLTDNKVLVDKLVMQPALMCVQRKAEKIIATEDDIVVSNINSFGDEIGKTTNWITSMFDVRNKFEKGSREYEELSYRIMCGQLYQQNAIDKAKGIVAKSMPRSWYDKFGIHSMEDGEEKEFYYSIVADKKPYFMRLIYPRLMKQYNTYVRNTNKNCLREFRIEIDELLSIPTDMLTDRQKEFVYYYNLNLPVSDNDCVMNKICRKIEAEFNGYIKNYSYSYEFDYTIMKRGVEYTKTQYNAILKLYTEYNKRMRDFDLFTTYERLNEYDYLSHMLDMRSEFVQECDGVCKDRFTLCDILLDVCYSKKSSKMFAWEMCSSEIVENLLVANNRIISAPIRDDDGDIEFGGRKFKLHEFILEVAE